MLIIVYSGNGRVFFQGFHFKGDTRVTLRVTQGRTELTTRGVCYCYTRASDRGGGGGGVQIIILTLSMSSDIDIVRVRTAASVAHPREG